MHLTHSRTPKKGTLALVVAISAATLTLTACGSGTSSDSSGSSASTTKAVTNDEALAYTGGKAGKADSGAKPVVIGFVNQQGGIPDWPESTVAAKAAVSYINEELGGIGGHPIKLKTCFVVSSEEDGQKCGQEMANDPKVQAVVTGNLVVGNASLYKTIGTTKPVLGTPTTLPDFGAPNNINLVGAGFSTLPAMAIFAATELKAKNVAMVYGDEPGGQSAAGLVADVLGAYGVELTKVPVAPTSTDLIGAITAAKAQKADAFLAVVTAPLCTQIAKAQEQLGLTMPVVTTVLCLDNGVKESLGDLPKWFYGQDTTSAFVPGADKQADTFAAKVTQYGSSGANLGGFAPHPFAKFMTLTQVLNEVGADATPKQLDEGLRGFEGPQWMGPDAIKCGALADMPAICNISARVYEYKGDDKWTDATGGKWLSVSDVPQG